MSGEDRTEKATPQRMKKVREEGKLSRSQDLSAWIGLGAAALMLPVVASNASGAAQDQIREVENIIANPSTEAAVNALHAAGTSLVPTMLPMFAVAALAALVANVAQGGVRVRKFKMHVKQLNLAKGIKNLFSKQTLWQGGKALLKSLAVGAAMYTTVQSLAPNLLGSGLLSLSSVLATASAGVTSLLRVGIAAGIALAIVDVVVVMRRNRKQTRMTKQEVKEENKRTEGDPQLKQAVRSKQMSMSRNRMMSEVATSDVLLVNPTHVAVALKYEPGKGAPRLVAKGEGHVAAKMRQAATEHGVPLVEDVPLARALHAACEVGQQVPADLFTNVARVLAFVMALKKRGAAAGKHRLPPGVRVPVPDKKSWRQRRRRTPTSRPTDIPTKDRS